LLNYLILTRHYFEFKISSGSIFFPNILYLPTPSFRISRDFPSYCLLGCRGIFRRSAVRRFRLLGFGVIFRRSSIPRFHLLGFEVIFCRSLVLPFHRSIMPALKSPVKPNAIELEGQAFPQTPLKYQLSKYPKRFSKYLEKSSRISRIFSSKINQF